MKCSGVGAPPGNRSIWRNFQLLANQRWSAGNVVLIGDALRTGHFSIGSGTRLGFDDAIALDRALGECGDDVPALLMSLPGPCRRPAFGPETFAYRQINDLEVLFLVRLGIDAEQRARLREQAIV